MGETEQVISSCYPFHCEPCRFRMPVHMCGRSRPTYAVSSTLRPGGIALFVSVFSSQESGQNTGSVAVTSRTRPDLPWGCSSEPGGMAPSSEPILFLGHFGSLGLWVAISVLPVWDTHPIQISYLCLDSPQSVHFSLLLRAMRIQVPS